MTEEISQGKTGKKSEVPVEVIPLERVDYSVLNKYQVEKEEKVRKLKENVSYDLELISGKEYRTHKELEARFKELSGKKKWVFTKDDGKDTSDVFFTDKEIPGNKDDISDIIRVHDEIPRITGNRWNKDGESEFKEVYELTPFEIYLVHYPPFIQSLTGDGKSRLKVAEIRYKLGK